MKSSGANATNEQDNELTEKLAKLTTEHNQKKAVTAALGLPENMRASLTYHDVRGTIHWSARVSMAFGEGELGYRKAMEVFVQHQPGILMVPRFVHGGCLPSWGPESANHSAGKPDSVHVDDVCVELTQSGNQHYRAQEISYWLKAEGAGFIEVSLCVNNLPREWTVGYRFRGYSVHDGLPDGVEVEAPRAGLPNGLLRRDIGSRGSWDHRAYWDNAETFRADILRAV